MKNDKMAILTCLILLFSSVAGCLEDEATEEVEDPIDGIDDIVDDSNSPTGTNATTDNNATADNETVVLGNVLVSTYHVEQLVSAVGGEHLDVQIISPSNVPVHDYEPSAADLVTLMGTDLFFYHGLNLEPWVEQTLESLGNDAPMAIQTHAMPSGEDTLDYGSILIADLCEHMSEGPYEAVMLADEEEHAAEVEIHAEHVAHSMTIPEDDGDDHDDHDDHGDENGTDDHDDHDDHEGHDDHDQHDHAAAEQTIENPVGCPTGTVIMVFHLEEGEHVLEFESEDMHDFNMVALKMPGGHAHHHDHGHGDGPFEWAGIFSMDDATHTWSMQKVDGAYADPTMRLVLIPTDSPTEETMHSLEGGVEALIEGDSCTIVEDGEMMASIDASGSCYELHVGTGDDSTFTIDTAGISGLAMYAQHVPTEFERDQHYLHDSTGNPVEPIAQEGAGAHGDHGGHDDHDDHDDHEEQDDHDEHDDQDEHHEQHDHHNQE